MATTNDISIHITQVDQSASYGEARHPLYVQYAGQSQPQGAYIALDCRDGQVWADYNGEVGNAVPMDVWHGHVQRFSVPASTDGRTINWLMDTLRPEFATIASGYEEVWDGSNHVARFGDEAEAALSKLGEQAMSGAGAFAALNDIEPCLDECPVCYPDN